MIEKKNLRDSYKYYRDTVENPINDIKLYLEIVLGFIQFIMNKVLDGFDVELSTGNSLGTLGIRGTKVKPRLNKNDDIRGLAPDWVKTRELWNTNEEAKKNKEIFYCFNEHTNGIRYRFIWYLKKMNLPNKNLYSLIFSKGNNGNKRKLSKLLKEGKEYALTIKS